MWRLAVPLGVMWVGAACDAVTGELTKEKPPFKPTAFLDLAKFDEADAGSALAVLGEGRFLLVQQGGFTFTYDLESLANVGFETRQQVQQGGAALTVVDDLLILPAGVEGVSVVRFADGGARFEPVFTSSVPADRAFVGDDRVVLWNGSQLWLFDRASFLGGAARAEDAILTKQVSLLKAAAARGDTLWIGQDPIPGVSTWDVSAPDAPVELNLLGDSFAQNLGLHGDTLWVGQGYDGGAYDVSDPAAPVALGRLWGGQGMSVYDGYYYGVDRSNLYILDLDTPHGAPEPVYSAVLVSEDNRFIDHMGDCLDVVASQHGVFVSCAGALLWLTPNTP
jgi:hypothetical protein